MNLQKTLWLIAPCVALLWFVLISNNQDKIPQICEDYFGIGKDMTQKLAEIAFEESKRKNVSMTGYNSVFATIHPDTDIADGDMKRKSGLYGVRFSPFHCDEMGLDGGGFDVDIDPKTLKVIGSYMSTL